MERKRHWVDQHWFWRGFQSAVFLYAQCGPCIAWRESHRQKKHYKREKQERARDPDHPDVVRQPAPHEVNPHWAEEIRLGPGLPRRGKKRANTKNSRDTASSGTLVASDTTGSSKSDLQRDTKGKLPMHWNSRRYQRADEEYAYVDHSPDMVYAPPGLIRTGSSVGIAPWMMDTDQLPEKPKKAYTPSANIPPVNELHPPVVSSVPQKKEDRAWMTAPPPSAAFMHGKKGVTTRSRSGSGNSSMRNPDTSLSRQMGLRIVEEKIKNGETPVEHADIIVHLSDPVSVNELPAEERSPSTSPFRLAREKAPTPMMRPRRRPAPLRLHTDQSKKSTSTTNPSDAESHTSSSSSSSTQRGRPRLAKKPLQAHRMTARSALNSHPISPETGKATGTTTSLMTTMSNGLSASSTLRPTKDSTTPTPPSSSHHPTDDYDPSPRKRKDTKLSSDDPPLLVKDSSLHVLQDIVDPNVLLDSQWVKSPVIEARVPLPPGDSPRKENEIPIKLVHASAKEELLIEEGARRWSWGI